MAKTTNEKLYDIGYAIGGLGGVTAIHGAIPALGAGAIGALTGNSVIPAIAGGLTGGLIGYRGTKYVPVAVAAAGLGAAGGYGGGALGRNVFGAGDRNNQPKPSNPAEELMLPHPALNPEFLYSEIRRLDKVQEEAYNRARVNGIYKQSLAAVDGQNNNRIEPHY